MSKREILMIAFEVIAGLWDDCNLEFCLGEENAKKVQNAVNHLVSAFQGYTVNYW